LLIHLLYTSLRFCQPLFTIILKNIFTGIDKPVKWCIIKYEMANNNKVEFEEKTERNQRLYDLWKSGKYKSRAALARLFRISRARASYIILRMEARERDSHNNK